MEMCMNIENCIKNKKEQTYCKDKNSSDIRISKDIQAKT